MKVAFIAIALVLLGSGSMVLIAEGRALSQLDDKRIAFANGNGFRAERDARELMTALVSDDRVQLRKIVEARLADAPFNPLLKGLQAELFADRDVLASARLLDQAQAIAPRDRRVRALRDRFQVRLQSPSRPASKWGE